MKMRLLLLSLVSVAACGAPVSSANVQSIPCTAQAASLLAVSELPVGLTLWNENSSPNLGLLHNGDSAYKGFLGRAQRTFLWTGLYSGAPRDLVNRAWSALNYPGQAPVGFIPHAGALFTTYPGEIYRLSEASLSFGSVASAQQWMTDQRQENVPNSDPLTRNGIETNPATGALGDDTFAYTISSGPNSDVYTDIQARVGDVVYGVGIDGGPRLAGVSTSAGLMRSLLGKEHAVCSSVAA